MEKEIQVLFLDDEEGILDSLQRLFIREPYGIFTTTSAQEAKEVLGKEKIKVVVCDQRMPQIQGVDFLKEIKQAYPDVVRILFTGHADPRVREQAINEGEIYRFINKPWETVELLSAIRQCIDHYDLIAQAKVYQEELVLANKKLHLICELQKGDAAKLARELQAQMKENSGIYEKFMRMLRQSKQ